MQAVVRKRLGLAVTCATVLLSGFLLSVVYSAQNVSFWLSQDVRTEWRNGKVRLSIPFSVRNHGVYDIEDVVVVLELRDNAGQILTKTVNVIGTIKAGSELRNYINITFKPLNLLLQVLLNQIFYNRTLELHARASLSYALSWITLEAEASIPLTLKNMAREVLKFLVNDAAFKFNQLETQSVNNSLRFTLPFSISYLGHFNIENFELNLEAKNSAGDVVGLWEITLYKLRHGENKGLLNITLHKELVTKGLALVSMFTIRLQGEINGFSFEWAKNLPYSQMG
jgi:hypothetical protein